MAVDPKYGEIKIVGHIKKRGHIIPPGVSVISLTSRFENLPHMTSLVGVSIWKHICSKIQMAMQFAICNSISNYVMQLTMHYAIS